MSRFYANIIGNHGEATRQGSASSGITAHPRGWNLGIHVSGYPHTAEIVHGDTGRDAFDVRATGGSNENGIGFPLVKVAEIGAGKVEVRYFTPDGDTLAVLERDRDGWRFTSPTATFRQVT